jgi:hypothetical protein
LQRYKLKNLPFFQEVREALETKCDCPHCLNKDNQTNNAGKYYENLTKNCKKLKKSYNP